MRIVAIVAAYNEADVIEQTTRDLIEQGVQVYLLDDGSTDGTAEAARSWLGRGLIGIESIPRFPGPDRFRLKNLLARKEALCASLDADWFLNHDADELRESPWAHLNLSEAIAVVDRMGFNAIDFEVLNFCPVDDGDHRPGDDLRVAFPFWTPAPDVDKLQIRCWRKQPVVDLQSTAGHEARFEGRRVFPIRFLLRHYPIRSQSHGERKVFRERLPRFSEEEVAAGWHIQYQGIGPDHRFVARQAGLRKYDADEVRAALAIGHRTVEALERDLAASKGETAELRSEIARDRAGAERVQDALEAQLRSRSAELHELCAAAARSEALALDLRLAVQRLQEDLKAERLVVERSETERSVLRKELSECERRVDALLTSRTWRWTRILRRIAARTGLQ